jgi:hypothetical protein
MSTEAHNQAHDTGQEPIHTDVAFEEQDIKVNAIYGYLFLLAVATVAAFVICIFILRFTTSLAASTDVPPPPSRQALGKDFRTMPPEPRLQGVPGHGADAQQDLRDKLKMDTEANEMFGWIDEKSGIAQIPVKDAMKIIAENGLPVTPAPLAETKK